MVDVLWPMMSAACLTVAAIYLFAWTRRPVLKSHLLIGLTAACVAIISHIELEMLHADTPSYYESLVRWGHVWVVIVILGVIGFIRLQYHAGSPVLALMAAASRVACLVPNFLFGANLNYANVHSLMDVTFLGTNIRLPDVAEPNPWMWLGSVNALFVAAFVGQSIVEIVRRPSSPSRTRGIWTCASLLLFVLMAGMWAGLVVQGFVHAPLLFTPTFLCVLLIMCYKLSGGVASAEMLAGRLDTTTKRLRTVLRTTTKTVRATSIGLLYIDMESGRARLSHHARVLLGVSSRSSSTLEEIMDRVPALDRDRLLDVIEQAVAGEDIRCEFRVETAEDDYRWLAMRGSLIVDTAGRQILDGILADVTERRMAESRFRQAVEAADGAQLVVTPTGKVAFANKAAAEIFGYFHEDMAGMDFSKLLPTDGAEDEAARSGHQYSVGVIEAGKGIVGIRKGGKETVPLKAMFNPVPVESDVFQLVSLADFSEKRSAGSDEAMLRDEVAHLSRVALMATLSGSLAHELNQPLAAILANAQAARRILDGQAPDMNEVSESLAAIVENDKRAAELIRRLRALLRRDTSGFCLFDMANAIDESLRIFGSELLTRGVEITVEGRGPLPPINGDSIQIQQVVLNILMNACDAMEDRPSPKRIVLRVNTIGDAFVQVSVADQGMGIAAEDISRVFHPFFTSKSEGLGLGLSVCSTIVMAHGGDISVQSDGIGEGASVSFRLPFAVADADQAHLADPGVTMSH